jgi:hypothetical protein
LILIVLELFPFITNSIEKYVENFIQKGENDSLGIALIDEGIGGHWFVGHLNMTDHIIVDNTVSGILSNARKRLSHNEFKRILYLAAKKETNVRNLVVPVDDANLFLLVLNCYHASKYHHLSNYRNYYQ